MGTPDARAVFGADTEAVPGTVPEGTQGSEIFDVQEAHAGKWMQLPGVVGTGVGRCDGELCIKVYVSRMTSAVKKQIPERVGGYPVRVEVTGRFRAGESGVRDTGQIRDSEHHPESPGDEVSGESTRSRTSEDTTS